MWVQACINPLNLQAFYHNLILMIFSVVFKENQAEARATEQNFTIILEVQSSYIASAYENF